MRNYDALERRVVKILVVAARNNRTVVTPVAIDRKYHAAARSGSGLPGRVDECIMRQGGAGNDCSSRSYEIASVHVFPFPAEVN